MPQAKGIKYRCVSEAKGLHTFISLSVSLISLSGIITSRDVASTLCVLSGLLLTSNTELPMPDAQGKCLSLSSLSTVEELRLENFKRKEKTIYTVIQRLEGQD